MPLKLPESFDRTRLGRGEPSSSSGRGNRSRSSAGDDQMEQAHREEDHGAELGCEEKV